jgi:dipeptidyl aminopeptidase/acylaminoacyl peptidase
MAPKHSALYNAALPDLIPVRAFVANPKANFGYKVSPDGKKLAWIDVQGTGTAIFVRTLGRSGVTILPIRTSSFRWAQDSHRIFVGVFMADINDPDHPPVDLIPFEATKAWIHQILRFDPAHVLIAHNRRDKTVFDLYRVNLETHVHTLIAQNPGDVVSWITDRKGNLRGRVRKTATAHQLELWHAAQNTWKTMSDWHQEESVNVVSFTADDKGIWLLSNRGRDRIALVQMHGETGKETLVYDDPRVDVEGVVLSRVAHTPMMAFSYPDYQNVHFFDAVLQDALMSFQAHEPTGLSVLSADNRERLFTMKISTPRGTAYYLYNRDTHQKTLLGKNPIAAYASALSSVQPIAFTSRDGRVLHGYLTLPQGTTGTHLPMVLLVHGGPWGRDYWGYNSLLTFPLCDYN